MADAHRYVLPRPPQATVEVVSARLWAAGALGVWERSDTLVAWFDRPTDEVPGGGRWEREPDRDWQAEWKATVAPVSAGRITVVPTWLAAEHERRRADEITLVLDPGRAFGSGHHATTTLCLELLQEVDVAGLRVLDVGCGTGVLALAAVRLGAGRVQAVDVDADAVEVTRENAARNEVELATRVGSVGDADRPTDVVLANLVTDTIVALADRLSDALVPGGVLIASGIAAERAGRALAALRSAGLDPEVSRVRDGWTAVRCRRASLPSRA